MALLWFSAQVGAAEPVGNRTAESGLQTLTFEQHVRPLFKAACFQCHGEDLQLVRLMETGGDSGPAVVPGDVEPDMATNPSRRDAGGTKKLACGLIRVLYQALAHGSLSPHAPTD